MPNFIKITDIDGDVHLINTKQLCFCDIEKRGNELYMCTLTFCDNISSFYLNEADAIGVFDMFVEAT